jgi:hypothetical protein
VAEEPGGQAEAETHVKGPVEVNAKKISECFFHNSLENCFPEVRHIFAKTEIQAFDVFAFESRHFSVRKLECRPKKRTLY